jgi:xylulokinase
LFMLGAEAAVDFSLANRTMLFDVDHQAWSDELLGWASLDSSKLPKVVPSGTVVGSISAEMAAELGVSPDAVLVSGAHDQCANAVGCGVIKAGRAVYGMGTFFCITPAFRQRREPAVMLARGLNTEHHAVPGLFASFIYNQGGVLVKWFRDTFAAGELQQSGGNIYEQLIAEMPAAPSSVFVLPHFAPTGPPEFITDSCGVIVGLQLETTRGDILKGVIEGTAYYLKEIVDSLPPTGINIQEYRATGGGAQSDRWVQTIADIMDQPVIRPQNTEAGALGAAIIAGVGSQTFSSYQEGVEAMVRLDRTFEPDLSMHRRYQQRFEKYRQLGPLMRSYLHDLFTSDA